MPAWVVIPVCAIYIGALFAIAWRGDRKAEREGPPLSPLVYSLAIAVYCTSWTFFGAVGTATVSGWNFLPIYLGPALVFLLLAGTIRRIGDISQRESISSLGDFLAARYGKSRALAATASIAAVAGTVPYIALQLKSLATSFDALTLGASGVDGTATRNTVLFMAIALGVFAILFGTRHADTTRRNTGLMHVLAFEAVVKIVALFVIFLLSLSLLGEGDPVRAAETTARFQFGGPVGDFVTMLVLSMAAIICLPRQFHVAIVERTSAKDVIIARWVFPAYLAVTSLLVLPIAIAGSGVLGPTYSPDLYVIALPLSQDQSWIALLVFLGGLSAAAGMVVVSCIALSVMVTNDLILPFMLRRRLAHPLHSGDPRQLITVRRIVILVLLLLAYTYYQFAGTTEALAQIGLISFAAAAQFAPALIGAIYWTRGHRDGALGGLVIGMVVWLYTLVLPEFFGADLLREGGLSGLVDPQRLLAIDLGSPLTHGTLWSLGLNVLAYVTLSLRASVRLRDRIQAGVFTNVSTDGAASLPPHPAQATGVTPNGLKTLAARFLGGDAVDAAFTQFERDSGQTIHGDEPADWRLVQRTERLLASVLGSSSARVVMSSALAGSAVALNDVLSILDQQTQAQRFDRHMLQSMLEKVSQGISVVDGNQRLMAWNSTYVDMFKYPGSVIRLGQPIADLIAHNIQRGWIETDDPGQEINNRVAHIRRGVPHNFERRNPDGRWLRISGMPMPGGGYVSTFTDITQDKTREAALIEAAETLEARVAARTDDLTAMASDLDKARQAAEQANLSKTRFLAAASHDLLQPLNAARLFLGALSEQQTDDTGQALVQRTDRAIESADQLLRGLLDISKLDQSDVEPKLVSVAIGDVLEELTSEARPMAQSVGLSVDHVPTGLRVSADVDFLKSILRNFLSNARRYTREGRILVGVRRRGDGIRIEVWDTGPGIPLPRQSEIFEEFQRFEEVDNSGVRGAGLGLAIAQRLATAMGASIGVRSTPGKGSVFYLDVARAEAPDGDASPLQTNPASRAQSLKAGRTHFAGLRVLCVDDEPSILDSMQLLLKVWGCNVQVARTLAEASAVFTDFEPHVVLLDLQLADGETGLQVAAVLSKIAGGPITAALITANNTDATLREARLAGLLDVLAKPIDPKTLRETLKRMATLATGEAEPGAYAAE